MSIPSISSRNVSSLCAYTRRTFLLFLTFILFLISPTSYAQVSSYAFTESSSVYVAESVGGLVENSGKGGNFIDDNAYLNQPIGFNFEYDGVSYNTFSISSNGFISIGSTVSSIVWVPLSNPQSVNMVSALGMDLSATFTNSNSNIRWLTKGAAPNRTLIVQWTEFRPYGSSGVSISFQIRLNEGSNTIDIVYGDNFNTFNSSFLPEVGLSGLSNADFNNRLLASPAPWLNNSTRGISNNNSMIFNQGSMPSNGTLFNWNPAQCSGTPDGGSSTASLQRSCSGVNFTVSNSGQSNPSPGYNYLWQSSSSLADHGQILGVQVQATRI